MYTHGKIMVKFLQGSSVTQIVSHIIGNLQQQDIVIQLDQLYLSVANFI